MECINDNNFPHLQCVYNIFLLIWKTEGEIDGKRNNESAIFSSCS